MTHDSSYQIKQAERATWVSMGVYLCVAIAKLLGGFFFHSQALLADGMNNFSDMINAVLMYIGLRFSRRPADQNHPYGHWKGEAIATLAMSFFILYIGLEVVIDTVQSFFNPTPHIPNPLTTWVALLSGTILVGLYLYNSRMAKRYQSDALSASSKDNLADAMTSFLTAATAFTSQFGITWLDQAMALIIGGIILKTGGEIFIESAFQLTDGFPSDELKQYEVLVANIVGVKSVKSIAARRYGANIYADVTILVDPGLSVFDSHEITEHIEQQLQEQFGVTQTDVHVEPNCPPFVVE